MMAQPLLFTHLHTVEPFLFTLTVTDFIPPTVTYLPLLFIHSDTLPPLISKTNLMFTKKKHTHPMLTEIYRNLFNNDSQQEIALSALILKLVLWAAYLGSHDHDFGFIFTSTTGVVS